MVNNNWLGLITQLNALGNIASSPVQSMSSQTLFQEEPLNSFGVIFQEALKEGLEIVEDYENHHSAPPLITKPGADVIASTDDSSVKTDFDEYITKAAETYHVPKKLIQAVIRQESNFNPNAVSPAGAMGLMQLMPATARSLGVSNPMDPEENIFGGTKYLRQLLDRFDNNIELALAAYNAGPGNVEKYGGIPPFQETENYVRNIAQHFYA
ncbi:lytic transglycosylase domain-containing protein [Bacillus smithii]|uniref:lytic transglycosylase domain-containing protein n=1 Tax=Bacillus smithii TaxID=1479 RepID=UPI0022E87BE9|nr:lytic transglycosylase domain-containing protein [Bacillus smithii]